MFERTREWLANRFSTGVSDVTEAPAAGGSKRDPKKIAVKKIGAPLDRSNGNFMSPAIDFLDMTRAYNTDSYVRRAVDKYAELMFKEGWDISGKDDAITQYVWTRLKLMAEGTGQSIDELFKDIAMDMVLYGNAFVVKARQKGSQAGGATGIKAVGYTGKQPIAGYFVLPPTTMKIELDDTGKVVAYQQDAGGGSATEIKPEDMVHFAYKRPRGRAFGVPYIYPVLDDVKLLRNFEENVARLMYRNLFPLYQYQVGLDKPGYEATDEEIEFIREQIREMPMDGGVVVPERHNISVVSSGSSSMNAEPYLNYFRQRVFSGLMVSDVVMGIGNTANRATADNLSSEMVNGVKEFQSIFRNTILNKIVNELLFEGGYDPTLNPDHEVDFVFEEIELDAKMKRENHAVQLFTQNAVTHEEMRTMIGKDPVTDEGRLYFNMVTIPTAVQTAQATAQAQADKQAQAANNAGSNKNQPANQNGKKPSAGKPKRSNANAEIDDLEDLEEDFSANVLTESTGRVNLLSELKVSQTSESIKKVWNSFKDDVTSMVRSGKSKDQIGAFVVHLAKQSFQSTIESNMTNSFYLGMSDAKNQLNIGSVPSHTYLELDKLKKSGSKFTDRLANDMKSLIFKAMDQAEMIDKLAMISGAFDSNAYRVDFISNTELYKAYNYGMVLVAKAANLDKVMMTGAAECKQCQDLIKEPLSINSPSLLDAIPPHHPNCTCTIDLNTPVEEV